MFLMTIFFRWERLRTICENKQIDLTDHTFRVKSDEKYRCSKGGYNFDPNNVFLIYTRKMGQITEFDLMANNFGEISNPPS